MLSLSFIICVSACKSDSDSLVAKLEGAWQLQTLGGGIWEWHLLQDSVLKLSDREENGTLDTLSFVELNLHPLRLVLNTSGLKPCVLEPIFNENDSIIFVDKLDVEHKIVYLSYTENSFNLIIEVQNGKIREQDHYHFYK
jgi:hypothetical protein